MKCLFNEKKTIKIIGPRTLRTKIPFGYRVVHYLDTF